MMFLSLGMLEIKPLIRKINLETPPPAFDHYLLKLYLVQIERGIKKRRLQSDKLLSSSFIFLDSVKRSASI